jgi:arabinogalactan endo-1,4-beta-galactosidase
MPRSILAFMLTLMAALPAQAGEFASPPARGLYLGADLSYVNEMDDCGAVYRSHGKPADPFALMKRAGGNLVRVRIWHDATWTNYSNPADVARTIRRAHGNGLQVLLDFHYSDDWADGDKQIAPVAWAALDTDAQAEALYDYTRKVLADLDGQDLMPEMVQVGNETNPELLGGTSKKPTDFDQIGISYYRKWSTRTLAQLGETIAEARRRYKVDVMVVETAYPFTTAGADAMPNLLGADSLIPGYPATPAGQLKYLRDLTQLVVDAGGNGVVYWEPAWISTSCKTRWGTGSGWENAAWFDLKTHEALPAFTFLGRRYQQRH